MEESVTLPQISILSSATDLLETAKSINKELEPALKDEQRIQRSNIIVANLDGNLLDSSLLLCFCRLEECSLRSNAKDF